MHALIRTGNNSIFLSELNHFIRHVSLTRVGVLCPDLEFRLAEVPPDAEMKTDRVSMIALSSERLKLTFRVHYSLPTAAALTEISMNKKEGQIGDLGGRDFMNEYCNLTAGVLQQTISPFSGSVAIGIPMATVGRGQTWPPFQSDQYHLFDRWKILSGSAGVVCSTLVALPGKYKFTAKDVEALKISEGAGEVELF